MRARSSQSVTKPTWTTSEEQAASQPDSNADSQQGQPLPNNEIASDNPPRSDDPPRLSLAPGVTPSDITPSRIRQSTPSTLKRQGRPFDSPAIKRSGTAFAAPTAASTLGTTLPKSTPANINVNANANAIANASLDAVSGPPSPSRPIKRPRTSSATPAEGEKSSRKRRMPKWEDDPEEQPVDFAQVTMGEICKDLGKGRKSARYKELEKEKAVKRKEARKLAKERRLAAAAQDADNNDENQRTEGEAETSSRRGNAISVPIDPALTGDVGTSATPAASTSAPQEPEQEREETPERVLLKER